MLCLIESRSSYAATPPVLTFAHTIRAFGEAAGGGGAVSVAGTRSVAHAQPRGSRSTHALHGSWLATTLRNATRVPAATYATRWPVTGTSRSRLDVLTVAAVVDVGHPRSPTVSSLPGAGAASACADQATALHVTSVR